MSFANNYNINSNRKKRKSSLGSNNDSFESLPSVAGAAGENRQQSIQQNAGNGSSRLTMYIKDMPDFVIESPYVKISGQKTKHLH